MILAGELELNRLQKRSPKNSGGLVSRDTIVLRQWGSAARKFSINNTK